MSLKRISRTAFIALIGTGLIVFGAWGLWQYYKATHSPPATISAKTITHSTKTPDEASPADACDNYTVADHEPRKIELPSLQVSGCIQKVGIDQHNAIAVPDNIHLAGWYTSSALPGEAGTSILDGHVSGRYADGIFKRLEKLNSNDSIKIQFGDLSWREFTVTQTDSFPVKEVAEQLTKPLDTVDAQLILITCSGTYDQQANTYQDRTIVRAAPTL